MAEPVIITNSISGAVANREQCPAIPYSNGDVVARARRMCEDVGRRPATVAEARERLGL